MDRVLIPVGIAYAQVMQDFREAIRDEVQRAIGTTETHNASEVGGIEVAMDITRLSKARIYTLVSERGIPHAKRGNKLYFKRTELLAWVAEGKRGEENKKGH